MPFRPHRWFGKRRRIGADRQKIGGSGNEAEGRKARRKGNLKMLAVVMAAVVTALVATAPQSVLADGHDRWQDEIDFELTEPVEGRRIFVEALTVSGDRADVTVRAATDIELRTRAFGGPEGARLRFWGAATLAEGESVDYSLPLHGPAPSLIFSWVDALGQAGAFTITHERIPFPLPQIEGELCRLRIVSLGWTPGAIAGAVKSECVTAIEHPVELQTVAGHASVTETTLMDAEATRITGTLTAATVGSQTSVPFIPDGETLFSIPVATGDAIHAVTVEMDLDASLRIPIPPLTRLTHHEERTEYRTQTVSLYRPGTSSTVSERVSVTNSDGATSWHTISATLSIPGETVQKDVTLTIVHPERIDAEVVERDPISRSRPESLSLQSSVGSDAPYAVLALPGPVPEDPPAEQSHADDGLRDWFEQFGWEWPW